MAADVADLIAAHKPVGPAAPVEDESPPCCCCERSRPVQQDEPSPPMQTPQGHCPCQDTRPTALVQPSADPTAPARQGYFHALPELVANAIDLASTALLTPENHAPGESVACACCSGRELLATLHILRC
jgi:hypothetical protein